MKTLLKSGMVGISAAVVLGLGFTAVSKDANAAWEPKKPVEFVVMAGKGGGESIWISENRDDVVIVHDHPAIGLRAIENGFFFSRPFEKGVGVDQIILGKGIEFGAQSAHRAAALFRPEMGIRFARIRLEHT